MKQTIFTFLLGIFVTISIAAGTINSDLLTIKPAIPKSTICFKAYSEDIPEKILNYSRQGYQLQQAIGADQKYGIVVIMVKY